MKYLINTFICLLTALGGAATAAPTSSDSSQSPPGLLSNNAPPVVMLTMPKDHQLFFKVYSDYEDLDGDTIEETTFKATVEYIGYFDNKLCYQYNASKGWFEPKSKAYKDESTKVEIDDKVYYAYYCNDDTTTYWSGNFLNWASMTRIDILRQTFYGGKRVTPQPTDIDGVLLERSHIPGDAHSFAKYYDGSDLRKLTPYAQTENLTCPAATKDVKKCNLVQKGITLCNTSYNSTTAEGNASEGTGGLKNDNLLSQNTTNRPLIRVARGNFSLWAAGERMQCKYWDSLELNGGTVDITKDLLDPANSAKLIGDPISSALNKLMSDIFPTVASQPNYYFFHDSPSVNTRPKSDGKSYVAKYEPDYNGKAYTQKIVDLQAFVIACSPLQHVDSSPTCTKYGTKSKPTGILQDSSQVLSQVQWGLITGSFESNITGGALRRHVAPISNEIDADGEFNYSKSGATADAGLIAFLDSLRIVNWNYYASGVTAIQLSSYAGWGTYGKCGDPSTSYGRVAQFNNGECVSWGNPLSEILLDAYNYLSGTSTRPTPNDGKFFSNSVAKKAMTPLSWAANPLATKPTKTSAIKSCSSLNVLAINGSTTSHDINDISELAKFTLADIKAATTAIGTDENLGNANYFHAVPAPGTTSAEAGDPNSKVCKAAKITNLADESGICPEAPTLQGGYLMAGMAHKAYTTRNINPNNFESSIRTLGVTLAMGEAKIQIPNTSTIILPACRNKTKIGAALMGSCALVDFKILDNKKYDDLTKTWSGKYLIVWEDSQQGSDFDQDATQLITYIYDGATKLTVTTKALSESTGDTLELGYTIAGIVETGTIKEGYQGLVSIHGSDTSDETIYTTTSSSNQVLEPPLFYAAKWGGFDDLNNDNKPLGKPEWDKYINSSRTLGEDHIPDNYLKVVNPEKIAEDIRDTLRITSPSTFNYAAIGSVNSDDDGSGFSISTLFRPELAVDLSNNVKPVSWLGSLTAYKRNAAGELLDSSDKPLKFEITLDKGIPVTKVNNKPISELNFASPAWSAENNLAKVTNYSTQVDYSTPRSGGRYIFTALDTEPSTKIDKSGFITYKNSSATHVAFDASLAADSTRALWLATPAGSEANLVNYIRGNEVSGYRSRRLNFIPNYPVTEKPDETAEEKEINKEPWLLGDIINSSPLIVGSPKAGYDRQYGDDTYNAFRNKYKYRRNVVYVGANDGMLHAFNVGKDVKESGDLPSSINPGDELWAYAPFNLLPNLKFLAEPNYAHNYFVDGRVKFYDVNIFPKDDVHTDGWGTILVVTMRTGGKTYPIDVNNDGTDIRNLRSAVIVLDVTNPEKPPKLLAEIPLPDGSYTTTNPDIVKFRTFNSKGEVDKNEWYLALATGVTNTTLFTSTQKPKMYLFNLSPNVMDWVDKNGTQLSNENGWVGGINSREWNGDYMDDYIYFGTVEGTPAAPAGQLYRAKVHLNGTLETPTKVIDLKGAKRAFAATPYTVVDKKNNYWVFAGTGRYFTDADNLDSSVDPLNQNSYYAVKEQYEINESGEVAITTTKATDTLKNLTGYTAQEGGNLNKDFVDGSTTIKTRKELENTISAGNGWYFDFESENSRNYTSTILINNTLVFNTYEPGNACDPYGNSAQYRLDFFSGLPGAIKHGTGIKELPKFHDLGKGAASDPTPGNKITTGTSLGDIKTSEAPAAEAPSSRQSWRELPFSP
ncbi:MAG: hypothetical protein RL497_841 [Pseudomonadota bacterium]|jgi:type IV pilus assembly protein PilY1